MSNWDVKREGEPTDYRIFKVREDVINIDGVDQKRVLIDSPDWVSIIAEIAGKFCLVRQVRSGSRMDSLEFPGGMVDDDEKPEVAAARELREESGLIPGDLIYLGRIRPNPAFMNNWMHVLLASQCTLGPSEPDDDEDLTILYRTEGEVNSMVRGGIIDHGLMLAAWSMYRGFRYGWR